MEILEVVPPLESELDSVIRDYTDILLRTVEVAYLCRYLDIAEDTGGYFLVEVGTESQSVVKGGKVRSDII